MSHPKKPLNPLGSALPVLDVGKQKGSLRQLGHQEDKDATFLKKSKKRQESAAQLSLFATDESRLTPNATILSVNLNSYVQDFQTRNIYQKLVPGLILGGENSLPFWTEFSQVISSALWLPTLTGSYDSDLSWLSGYAKEQDANSWFSMNVSSAPNKSLWQICCPSSIASVLGFTDSENTSSKSNKRYKKTARHSKTKNPAKPKPNSVLKIRLYPSIELHKVWKQWLAGYRRIYNWAIDKLKAGFDGNLQKKFLVDTSIPAWVQAIPSHSKQEACDEAFDAYQQARANGGTPRFKSCRASSQAIQFKAKDFLHGTWFPRTTKGLTFKASQPMPYECEYGTELIYQRGKWYACIPQCVDTIPTDSDRVIALDPGNRTFLTGYDGENILEIGKGDIGRINRLCSHLDKLMSRIDKSQVKRERHKMRKASYAVRAKIQALVKDLHNKAASLLVNSYKLILLPTYETSEMVLKSSRKINKKSARNMLTWSHFKFAQVLGQMAAKKGVLVVRCNESYTSKTCTNCGFIKRKLGSAKVFKCPECGHKHDRDWGGARNIMIRALQATAFTSNSNAVLTLNAQG